MLFDPNWQKPADIKLEPWQEILLKAADLIEKKGWIQGSYGHSELGFCTVGAIFSVNHLHSRYRRMAFNRFTKFMGMKTSRDIAEWNDAQGRCKEVVITRLRQAARQGG